MTKTTEERDAIRDRNHRRKNCSKCGGECALITGLDDDAHFPSAVYKRCITCGWEITMKSGRASDRQAFREGEGVEIIRDSARKIAPQDWIRGTYVAPVRDTKGWHWVAVAMGVRVSVPLRRIRHLTKAVAL